MRTARVTLATMLLGLGVLAPIVHATERSVLGKTFRVSDPRPGVDASRRSIVILARELGSDETVVGDPVANGATLEVIANGATSTAQLFTLPAGASWKPLGSPVAGYRYTDANGANGPVKSVLVNRTGGGTFLMKVVVKGTLGPGPQPHVSVVPPAPGTAGGVRLAIAGGDAYNVAFGGALGGAATNAPASGSPDKIFKIATTSTAPLLEAVCSDDFCDWGTGTLRSSAAGLEWEKKTGSVGGPMNPPDLHDVNNSYSWAGCCGTACTGLTSNYCQPNAAAEAACKAQTAPAQWAAGGCDQCVGGGCNVDPHSLGAITTVWDWVSQINAARFGGHDDWRLPTSAGTVDFPTGEAAELEGIAPIGSLFGPTYPYFYWSATTEKTRGDAYAWAVLPDGQANIGVKYSNWQVRAVR